MHQTHDYTIFNLPNIRVVPELGKNYPVAQGNSLRRYFALHTHVGRALRSLNFFMYTVRTVGTT